MGTFFKWLSGAFGLLVLTGVVFGVLIDTGIVPSDRVLKGVEVPGDHYDVLRTEGIVQEGEVIEYFYSEGLLSVREGGSVLTNKRVIAYEENYEDGIDIYEISNDEIVSVERTQEGNALNFAIYTVTGPGQDDWLDLWLPHEYGDAERFIAAVQAKIQ